jgi:hypothetical protein
MWWLHAEHCVYAHARTQLARGYGVQVTAVTGGTEQLPLEPLSQLAPLTVLIFLRNLLPCHVWQGLSQRA